MAFAVAALACATTQAGSASSPVGNSFGPSEEPTQAEILEHVYGGTFTRNGDDFTNGEVDVRAVSDDGADQIFQNDAVSARAVAAFARNSQAFGLLDDAGGFNPLFIVAGNGFDVSGSIADVRGTGLASTIAALHSGGSTFASVPARNPGQSDQVRGYSVTSTNGAPGGAAFLLFWEDTQSAHADFDYNDLVVEVAAGIAGPGAANVLIPLPAAAWSGLSVVGGLGVFAGIRRLVRGVRQ